MDRFDVAVLGAGFGGLAAALDLVEGGARVLLLERLHYPGGCAATFTREGHRFEAGATLFSGLDDTGLLGSWIDRHRLPVTVDLLDPVYEFRAPDLRIRAWRDRGRLLEEWRRIPGAPIDRVERFFRLQERLSDRLWAVLGSPELLPPWRPGTLLRLAPHALGLAELIPWLGRPLADLLGHLGLAEFEPLRKYLDSLCQITVQCGVGEAEVLFALGAIDYAHRGTGHVRGGVGTLARALLQRIESLGGTVRLSRAARALTAVPGGGWRIDTRDGTVEASQVIANLLPGTVRTLVGDPLPSLDDLQEKLEDAWGACMLYRTLAAPEDPAEDVPHHLQLRAKGPGEAIEGHHVFCSVSGADDGPRTPEPDGRTVTVSTHVPLGALRERSDDEAAEYVMAVQQRMRETLDALAPEWRGRWRREWTASPRTFARFTGRPEGCVGGVPRRAGFWHLRTLGPRTPRPGLHLVGDSVFPGQSALAAAIGGLRVSERVRRAAANG